MALQTETLQVTGIRCERCVLRLGSVLEHVEGLESASATLLGQVSLTWDDTRVGREEILAVMASAGFRPLE